MIPELIDYISELFPSITPYTAKGAKDAMKQFQQYGIKSRFVTQAFDDEPQQGDVFSVVPFSEFDEEGNLITYQIKGMLLTNSCDSIRNENLHFAAMWPLEDHADDIAYQQMIKSNCNFQFLYYPDSKLEDSYVDFQLITSVSRKAFTDYLQSGKTSRLASLNQVGYFILLSKLTVFFMRPEDADIVASRE